MGGPIHMPINRAPNSRDIAMLMQWFSPGYPVGAYSFSHGLEWAVETGDVHDGATMQAWTEAILRHGSGVSDARFVFAAYNVDIGAEDEGELVRIDAIARAFAPSKERRLETVQQGRAFCDITTKVWGYDLGDLVYPVAVGRAARISDLPIGTCVEMYVQAFMANLVSAAMRIVPLGQTEGQALIAQMTPLCAIIAQDAQTGTLDELSSTAFLGDIASMKHEKQYSRMFRT